jgi:hypothetical protein
LASPAAIGLTIKDLDEALMLGQSKRSKNTPSVATRNGRIPTRPIAHRRQAVDDFGLRRRSRLQPCAFNSGLRFDA